MLFTTLTFFVFACLALAVFWQLRGPSRLWLLAAANAVFYLAAGWPNLLLFLVASATTYWLGKRLDGPAGKARMVLGIALNLANLAWFKYAEFLASSLADWLHLALLDPALVRGILLPIGISFYTFQHISYLVDRRQKGLPPAASYLDFWVYISFFGHSIAGPIMRGHEFLPQVAAAATARFEPARLRLGLGLFVLGLVKKIGIATPLAAQVDPLFSNAAMLSPGEAWAAAALFAFQIYFDFSAYSDMAVGIGHMFGFTLPQNFRTPYMAANGTEFWRRWHVTLSSWIRDYVYIPLGGNRGGVGRQQLNLFLAMLASGLWHGANWTFILWGAYHGGLLLGHRLWQAVKARAGWAGFDSRLYRAVAMASFFALVVVGWVPFRCTTMDDSGAMWMAMANVPEWGSLLGVKRYLGLAVGLYFLHMLEDRLRQDEPGTARAFLARTPAALQGALYAAIAILFCLTADGGHEFIYFRF
ncbi:MAG: D-alanyl-lipoteichoic acid acyltransferase DltB, superfamily [Cyanobacteria bacterium RYN_339]|nr:D-alanyl-lipoteichoic acid acyltransferase DltB, superfamily [Cyanobacteria bacterium RYN_339]